VRTSATGFSKYFEELPFSRIALEAGTHSGRVSRLLETPGHIVVVATLVSCVRFIRVIARMTGPTPGCSREWCDSTPSSSRRFDTAARKCNPT
jgi:hypothetical protein